MKIRLAFLDANFPVAGKGKHSMQLCRTGTTFQRARSRNAPLPPLFLPILPSHRESIWENGGEFLRGTMMDLAAITPLPQHQTSSSLQKEKKSISDLERRLEKSKTYDWVLPHSLFPAHIHVWMCPATITQECRTKSPFSRPCPAPHSPFTPMKESFLIPRSSSTVDDDTTRASKL